MAYSTKGGTKSRLKLQPIKNFTFQCIKSSWAQLFSFVRRNELQRTNFASNCHYAVAHVAALIEQLPTCFHSSWTFPEERKKNKFHLIALKPLFNKTVSTSIKFEPNQKLINRIIPAINFTPPQQIPRKQNKKAKNNFLE